MIHLLLLAAAVHAGDPEAPLPALDPHIAYACEDGTRFTARFRNDVRTVEIAMRGGRPLTLPQQPAASGFDYATPMHRLRGKGPEAWWTVGRKVATRCVGTEAQPR
ncbi:MAG: MliC family protein [Alphaproteobacteria bacterium]|nr:MliC family protein [Alphaproteobacteria bacterium]